MPRLSDSMEEGIVVAWLKHDGATVARNEVIVEIETDKATMPYESPAAGLLSIIAREGESVRVGGLIGRLLPGVANGEVLAPTNGEAAAPTTTSQAGRVTASPLARRIAKDLGVDLSSIVGSGPNGRIVAADLDPGRAGDADASAEPAPSAHVQQARESTPTSRVEGLIARRMAEAKRTIPEFTVSVDVNAGALFDARNQLRTVLDPAPSITDFVVAAVARALREHPRLNSSYSYERSEPNASVSIGIAVASDDALLVPTVRDVDGMTIGEIARESSRLIRAARSGTAQPHELEGGTFTVSNLGMFGIRSFTAIINAPQVAILAVGAAVPRLALDTAGRLVERPVIDLTLSADHRLVYGSHAAHFLASVRKLLEQPYLLLT